MKGGRDGNPRDTFNGSIESWLGARSNLPESASTRGQNRQIRIPAEAQNSQVISGLGVLHGRLIYGLNLPAAVASRLHIPSVQFLGNARQGRDTAGPDLLDNGEDR